MKALDSLGETATPDSIARAQRLIGEYIGFCFQKDLAYGTQAMSNPTCR
jgi:hypothetical protein